MKHRILIVEDDPAIATLISSMLTVSGYETVCAADGKLALDAICSGHFDLALCDIMLPELDGFELLPYMKEQEIPVIYVSAKADVQSRVKGLRLGAEDYLVKPFDILELMVRMEKVLARADKLPKQLTYRDITVDEESCSVTRNGDVISLKHMRQRLGIAQALLDDPELLILDEPMNGLDKNGMQEIRSLILNLKAQGKTILLASHFAQDIDVLCDHVYEMDQGNMKHLG